MNSSWSIFMLGLRADYAPSRQLLWVYTLPIAGVIKLLYDESDFCKGIMLVQHRWGKKLTLIRGDATTRPADLRDLVDKATVFPFDQAVNSDFTFVPWTGRRYPRTKSRQELLDWACEQQLPWIRLFDNQYAVFSGFPKRIERKIFVHFLSRSIINLSPEDLKIPWGLWLKIRKPLCTHGWTMNRCACSWAKGEARFELWGGTLRASLVKAAAHLSEVNKRLTLKFDRNGKCEMDIRSIRCPLDDLNGQPSS